MDDVRDPYREAGVDIGEADRTVTYYRQIAESTPKKGVLSEIGHFAGLYALPSSPSSVLVSGADGVGTKLLLAKASGCLEGVGIDLVAMVVNDILTLGAKPLFLLDYLATDRLHADEARVIVESVAEGCRQADCALLGGETAELPGVIAEGVFDLAGFGVGVVDRDRMVTGRLIAPGDVILGLGSSGLHANGFSLVRRILARPQVDTSRRLPDGKTLMEALLTPTRIYVRSVLPVLGPRVHGLCHVTGGGIPGNLVRILPPGVRAVLRKDALAPQPVVTQLMRLGGLSQDEVLSVWNLGWGFLVVAARDAADGLAAEFERLGERVGVLGSVAEGERGIFWQ